MSGTEAVRPRWTGPNDDDWLHEGTKLKAPVPPERWPYGPPSSHETCCALHRPDGVYCGCRASDASDDENWGAPA